MSEAAPLDLDDDSVAAISDFIDGTLTGPKRDEVAAKVASDPAWKQTHDEMVETRNFMSGMQKAHAPGSFAADVTSTIHKRSAGRFFARRTLGDRVPFGVIVVFAVLGLIVIAYLMWASETGSLKTQPDRTPKDHSTEKLLP